MLASLVFMCQSLGVLYVHAICNDISDLQYMSLCAALASRRIVARAYMQGVCHTNMLAGFVPSVRKKHQRFQVVTFKGEGDPPRRFSAVAKTFR